VTSGVHSQYNANIRSQTEDIELSRVLPTHSVSAGYTPTSLFDGETRLDEIQYTAAPTTKLRVNNKGSETGFQTRVDSYTSPDDYLKIRENPKVAVLARPTFGYEDSSNISSRKVHFQPKIQPIKSYDSGLNRGTIHRSGVEAQGVNGRYFANKRAVVY
jgi:hypothetical protein